MRAIVSGGFAVAICAVASCQRPMPAAKVETGPSELNDYLVEATRLYDLLEYEQALSMLGRAKDYSSSQAEVALVALYQGVIFADTPRLRDQAESSFRYGLRLWPRARVPIANPAIEARFEKLRSDLSKKRVSWWERLPTKGIDLVEASELFERLDYENALEALARAEALAASRADLALVLLYRGVVYADLPERRREADAAFKAAISLWPHVRLPVSSPKLEQRLEELKREASR